AARAAGRARPRASILPARLAPFPFRRPAPDPVPEFRDPPLLPQRGRVGKPTEREARRSASASVVARGGGPGRLDGAPGGGPGRALHRVLRLLRAAGPLDRPGAHGAPGPPDGPARGGDPPGGGGAESAPPP